jgi:hypothetical protein
MNASRNPLDAMYIKTSQPTKRALPAKKKKEKKKSENQPRPDRLQMHVKTNNIFICSISRD